MTKLAIVVPICDEEQTLPELCRRLRAACDSILDISWQAIFVVDGGGDRSAEMLMAERASDARIAVVELSRNFGQQAAVTAGLAHADADAIVVMDGDLQDPPELIPELVTAWRSGGQVVRAERRSRQEFGARRLGIDTFHRVFNAVSGLNLKGNAGMFCLLDRRAAEELNRLPERHRFLPGLSSWVGFDQRSIKYDRHARVAGEPKQTWPKLIQDALDAIFSFSFRPLRLMMWFGLLVSGVAFVLASIFVVNRLTGNEVAGTGFTTLVTLILFLGGIQLVAIGLLGEYLGRIYEETKQRPLYIVKRRSGVEPPSTPT